MSVSLSVDMIANEAVVCLADQFNHAGPYIGKHDQYHVDMIIRSGDLDLSLKAFSDWIIKPAIRELRRKMPEGQQICYETAPHVSEPKSSVAQYRGVGVRALMGETYHAHHGYVTILRLDVLTPKMAA